MQSNLRLARGSDKCCVKLRYNSGLALSKLIVYGYDSQKYHYPLESKSHTRSRSTQSHGIEHDFTKPHIDLLANESVETLPLLVGELFSNPYEG